MSFGMMCLILFGLFIVCLLMNIPIAFSLLIACCVFIMQTGMTSIDMVTQTMFATVDNFPLLAVPFFILSGELMSSGGIAVRLIDFAKTLVGHKTGGLGAIAILGCMIFAAISGSGTATAAAIGGIMIPIMIENKYKAEHSAATVGTAGALGPIIPPSIFFVLYGVIANVSISKLFIGGLLPGILVTISLLIVNFLICKKEGYPKADFKFSWANVIKEFKRAFFALLAPSVILGGIYGGVVTPTEAAVVGVIYSLIVSMFIYKELKLADLPRIFMKGGMTAATILIIMGPAAPFGKMMAIARIPQLLAGVLGGITHSPMILLLIINIVLLITGMLMEGAAAITILSPLLVPIVVAYGIDPLHFGIIMSVNLSAGLFTPPFGLNLFITSKIAGVKFTDTFKYLWPQVFAVLIALAVITVVPQLSTLLPGILVK